MNSCTYNELFLKKFIYNSLGQEMFRNSYKILVKHIRFVSTYKQGFSPTPDTREYFYYVNHQGQLFLDDTKVKNFITAFKDEKFLSLIFSRLKKNSTSRWQKDFHFLYICAGENNYIRCDDLPIVYTQLYVQTATDPLSLVDLEEMPHFSPNAKYFLAYGSYKGRLKVKFEPSSLCMHPENGRLYHTGPQRTGGVGLIRSVLADELSRFFMYEGSSKSPTHFQFTTEQMVSLTEEVLPRIDEFSCSV